MGHSAPRSPALHALPRVWVGTVVHLLNGLGHLHCYVPVVAKGQLLVLDYVVDRPNEAKPTRDEVDQTDRNLFHVHPLQPRNTCEPDGGEEENVRRVATARTVDAGEVLSLLVAHLVEQTGNLNLLVAFDLGKMPEYLGHGGADD